MECWPKPSTFMIRCAPKTSAWDLVSVCGQKSPQHADELAEPQYSAEDKKAEEDEKRAETYPETEPGIPWQIPFFPLGIAVHEILIASANGIHKAWVRGKNPERDSINEK